MALIKDGKILRTYEEQVAHLTEEHVKQLDINESIQEVLDIEQTEDGAKSVVIEGLDDRITALEEGGGGGGEPPANMMTTDTDQNVSGIKTFVGQDADKYTVINDDGVTAVSENERVTHTKYGGDGTVTIKDRSETTYELLFPREDGTLALDKYLKKYYLHTVKITSSQGIVNLQIIAHTNISINNKNRLANYLTPGFLIKFLGFYDNATSKSYTCFYEGYADMGAGNGGECIVFTPSGGSTTFFSLDETSPSFVDDYFEI